MKHLILTLAICCTGLLTFSQTNNWAPVGAKWVYGCYGDRCGEPLCTGGYSIWEVIGNTSIKGKSCRQLEVRSYGLDRLFEKTHYLYEDSGRVYHYYEPLDTFGLLYDFEALAGDTIKYLDTVIYPSQLLFDTYSDSGYSHEPILYGYVVDSIKKIKILLSGDSLTSYNVTPISDFGFLNIFKKLGSYDLFFGRNTSLLCCCQGELRCYSDSSSSFEFFSDCETPLSVENEILQQENSIVTIIRSLNRFTIESNYDRSVSIGFYLMDGRLLSIEPTLHQAETIEVHLPGIDIKPVLVVIYDSSTNEKLYATIEY